MLRNEAAKSVVLGLDPGITRTGYGLVTADPERPEVVEYGVITTSPGDLSLQLQSIYQGLRDLISRTGPTEAAVERLFVKKNVQTALAVGQARGVALLALAQLCVPVEEYAPAQVKGAIAGHGRGSKGQVQKMVQQILSIEGAIPDDAADALAVALCHVHSKSMKEALAKVSQSGP